MQQPPHDALIVFATKDVGYACLEALIAHGDPIARVFVTRPSDRDILDLAGRHDLPAEVADAETQGCLVAAGERFSWLVNLWGNQIFRAEFLSLFERRLNVHPALVPHCRGNDCATWAIRKDLPPGVSLLEIAPGIDDGDVYAQRAVPYRFPEPASVLQERLKAELVALFRDCWPDIRAGHIVPAPQEGVPCTHKRRETEADRRRSVDAEATLGDVVRWALAHDFHPQTAAEVEIDGRLYRLRIHLEPAGE